MSDKARIRFHDETDPKYQSRWERGIPHHSMSHKLMDHMMAVDSENGDHHQLKTGGDGDNGENLMFLMDGFFEKLDSEKPTEYGKCPWEAGPTPCLAACVNSVCTKCGKFRS